MQTGFMALHVLGKGLSLDPPPPILSGTSVCTDAGVRAESSHVGIPNPRFSEKVLYYTNRQYAEKGIGEEKNLTIRTFEKSSSGGSRHTSSTYVSHTHSTS